MLIQSKENPIQIQSNPKIFGLDWIWIEFLKNYGFGLDLDRDFEKLWIWIGFGLGLGFGLDWIGLDWIQWIGLDWTRILKIKEISPIISPFLQEFSLKFPQNMACLKLC